MLKKIYITEDTTEGKTKWFLSFKAPEFQTKESIEIDEETAKEILKIQNN